MRPVKIVVSGYIGFDNFGDESLLNVLLENLKTLSTQITVITSNPKKTAFVHGVKTVKTFDIFGLLLSILKSDILISGGGSLLQDKTSVKSLFYYLFVILSAKFLENLWLQMFVNLSKASEYVTVCTLSIMEVSNTLFRPF